MYLKHSWGLTAFSTKLAGIFSICRVLNILVFLEEILIPANRRTHLTLVNFSLVLCLIVMSKSISICEFLITFVTEVEEYGVFLLAAR